MTCDFQQCDILTSVDSDEPVQPPVKLRNSKWCSVSSLTVIEFQATSKGSDQTAHTTMMEIHVTVHYYGSTSLALSIDNILPWSIPSGIFCPIMLGQLIA